MLINLPCYLLQSRLHLPHCRVHTVFGGEHVLQTWKSLYLNHSEKEQNVNRTVKDGIPPCFKLNKMKQTQIITGIALFLWSVTQSISLLLYLWILTRISYSTSRSIFRAFELLTEVLGRLSYLGNCSFMFLHQLIHVLLILLHARLQVILLSLQTADLLLQLKH